MRTAVSMAVAAVTIAASSSVLAAGSYPRVSQYQLDAKFFPDEARMEGQATVYLSPAADREPAVTFYLHGELRVDSLKIDARDIEHQCEQVFYDYDYSLIATACKFALSGSDYEHPLTVFYSGYFNPSKVRSPSDYMRIDRDGVFLRAYAYSLWFPVFLPANENDYPVTFSKATIRTPSEFHSVFVGTKTGESEIDGWRVSEWSARDVSLFAAQCTAQRFQITSKGNYFLYHYADSLSTLTAGQILGFADRTNALYNKYYRKGAEGGQFYLVEMPEYGDISSDNVTGLTYWTWQSFMEDANCQRALGHELVHPYVAVPVDRADSLWSFAIEGFPSYLHLPVLAEDLGTKWYNSFLQWMEDRYVESRHTGTDRRGNPLPPEIPLLSITADKLSTYKDEFVLCDRALFFLNYLYSRMGKEKFFTFTSDMLNRDQLTVGSFRDIIEQYLPGSGGDVTLWLASTEFPERFHLAHLGAAK